MNFKDKLLLLYISCTVVVLLIIVKMNRKVLLFSLFWSISASQSYTPLVIWHGIGDTCCNGSPNNRLRIHLRDYLPGMHVVYLQIGNSEQEDFLNSYVLHPDKQIEIACKMIQSDRFLNKGYNAVGFSQGSVLLRGLAQRCPEPRMKTLITMAGQHQGFYGIPHCVASSDILCNALRQIANTPVYFRQILQGFLTPATYWHDPLNKKVYKRESSYLANINNENTINTTYIKNLQALEKFVMVKYGSDDVVQPSESSWFGYYKDGQAVETETLQESELYKSDRLGLKQMDLDGKLVFLNNTWHHADFDWDWFKENIVDKYLT